VSLIASGAINYFLIVGPSLNALISTQYGLLLSIKLSLFIGMLAFAAANRYLLSPKVELAITAGKGLEASRLLRRSLVIETTLAIMVVACVAWLGVLSPVISKAN
jgi:putative copper resistance protein D